MKDKIDIIMMKIKILFLVFILGGLLIGRGYMEI